MPQIATYEQFEDGQIIFEEGSNGDWLYVMEEGEVEISKNVAGRKVVIDVMKPGDIFGELSYLSKAPRSATAMARGKAVVGIMDRNFFDKEFESLSKEFQQMVRTVVARLLKTTENAVPLKTV